MMGYNNYWANTAGMGFFGGVLGMFLVPAMIWSLAWKGWALWKASKNDSKVWFVVLLLVNTLGILDILYIFIFGKEKAKAAPKKTKK